VKTKKGVGMMKKICIWHALDMFIFIHGYFVGSWNVLCFLW